MSFDIVFSDESKKFLDKLPKSQQQILLRKVYSIRENPYPFLKKLKGSAFWRLRVMDYRVVLDVIIKANQIFVVRIGHRKNVYDL